MKLDKTNEISIFELAKLGANDLTYIRPVHPENIDQFMISAEHGRKFGTAPTFQSAFLPTLENNFKPVSLHCTAR